MNKARAQYAQSFIYTEQDNNNLTYFHLYHLNIIRRSIDELQGYLSAKIEEERGLLMREKTGRKHAWVPAGNIIEVLEERKVGA
ncbi:hypothetical protein GCM10027445_47200 [Amycolatopsis endophytica]|uniref:Fic family protein n=1 Tax=Amycolatopsis endophytica TaxID=860233 RepID=A0A853AY89_9PSEU|nr:hypothetical protein [Amycolatopsis endophytica]NYI87733.1 Fic family protein [Amycolatopsis endophytica]